MLFGRIKFLGILKEAQEMLCRLCQIVSKFVNLQLNFMRSYYSSLANPNMQSDNTKMQKKYYSSLAVDTM